MPSICLYFQLHQPFRLRRYSVFDTGTDYFDEDKNREVCRKVARKCYLPATRLMLDLVKRHKGRFRLSYSLSGMILEQLEKYAPEVLNLFQRLAETGCVEFLTETYYHSMAFMYSRDEFAEQVRLHQARVEQLFGQQPRIFRNTELVYNNDLAHFIEQMGFRGALCEGADNLLDGRTPNALYQPPGTRRLKLLLRNYKLSDDIAFRFANQQWADWPLTAAKFAKWMNREEANGEVVNLFLDYETLGEHQWADTGIFRFLERLPGELFKHRHNRFLTPSEVLDRYPAADEYDVPHMSSWADTERDLSAWLGNAMQSNALHEVYRMEKEIKSLGDPQLLQVWRKMQTSDHFYYMCTKYFADGDVHKYFNPYDSPYDSYINYMNVMENLRNRLKARKEKSSARRRLA